MEVSRSAAIPRISGRSMDSVSMYTRAVDV